MQHVQKSILQFVFMEVALRHKHNWLGATRINIGSDTHASSSLLPTLKDWAIPVDQKLEKRLRGIKSFPALLEHFLLKGVRLDSHMGLWGLLSGAYPLRVRHDMPTPREMLDLQCQGERYITYMTKPEEYARPIGRFSGAYEFLMHDLEHAHKFFGDARLFQGQLTFFNCLRAVLPQFDEWQDDPLFTKDMNYLMSDMNSHPVHLFKYLKAIVLTAELRRGADSTDRLEDLWNRVLRDWQAPADVRSSAQNINRPGVESGADQVKLFDFFTRDFYHA